MNLARLFVLLLAICGFSVSANAAQVTFAWDQLDKTGVTGYWLGCGPAAGNNGTPVDVPGANTTTKALTLTPGQYFCAVWAYGTPNTLVSAKSNEVQVAIPPSAPGNLRYTVTLVWDEGRQMYAVYALPQ